VFENKEKSVKEKESPHQDEKEYERENVFEK
jgi:hypothetical protein